MDIHTYIPTIAFEISDFIVEPESVYYGKDGDKFTITCTSNYAGSGITVSVTWENTDGVITDANAVSYITRLGD